jgi:hypothetical protein
MVVVVVGGTVVVVVEGTVVVVEVVVVAAKVMDVVVCATFLASACGVVLQAAVRIPMASMATHFRLSTSSPWQFVSMPLARPHLRPAVVDPVRVHGPTVAPGGLRGLRGNPVGSGYRSGKVTRRELR